MTLAPPPVADARFAFELARATDDAAVRGLLKTGEMDGAVRIALACEPDARRAAALEGREHQRLIARDAETGRITATGCRSVRELYVNGEPTRVGYYAHLRIDGARATLLRRGFEEMRRLHERDGKTLIYFASVVKGNRAAQRILRAGLRGLPACVPAGTLVTLLVSSARRTRTPTAGDIVIAAGREELFDDIVACLNRNLPRFQLTPHWTAADLRHPERTRGLAPEDFRVAIRAGRVVGCAALWDQRESKQTLVRGYSRSLSRLRPAWNLWAGVAGAPKLPASGCALSLAFASHLAVDGDDPAVARALFGALQGSARERGIELVAVGLGASHPLLTSLAARARAWRYESDILLLPWPDDIDGARALDARPLQPEVAVL